MAREESAAATVRDYFRDVGEILGRPTRFFRRMPLTGGVSGPLAFALVTHWLGSAVSFIWTLLMRRSIGASIQQMLQFAQTLSDDVAGPDNPLGMTRHIDLMGLGSRFTEWFLGAGTVIADPFWTLFKIGVASLFVFVGARLFVTTKAARRQEGAPREVTYESALRVVCYGLTPSILSALPLLGGLVVWVFVPITTVIAAREAYHIGTGRAVVVGLFPHVLLLGLMLLFLGFMLVLLVKMLAMGASF